MITLEDVLAARVRIKDRVRHTPMMPASQMRNGLAPLDVTLKVESLQVTGSFKARGAMNKVLTLPPEQIANGLVTASGGNHGLAMARTGFVAGVKTTIFLPSSVVPDKVAKLRGWNANVQIVGSVFDEANEAALAFARETGAAYVHPFSDPLVVAGQGTVGLEILDDMPDVDTVLIAIGGGGLITGTATAMKAKKPGIRIVGIEPMGSPTMKASLDAGHVVTLDAVTTRVATMACRRTDDILFAQVRDKIDDMVLVSDAEMEEAAKSLWFEFGLATDLSGAASLAALRNGGITFRPGEKICALVCGAGTDGV
jgi:threonine dehydratase